MRGDFLDDECDYKTKRELVKTLSDIKEDATIVREQVKTLQAESVRHSEVHLAVIEKLDRNSEDLNRLVAAAEGREKYEQGLKHGVTGLWLVLIAGVGIVLWIVKNLS